MVKTGFKKYLAVFLLLLVFTTSTGLNIFTHLCSSSGYSEVSLQEVDACCANEADQGIAKINSDCCTTEHLLLRSDTPAVLTPPQIFETPVAVISLSLSIVQTPFQLQHTIQQLITTPPDKVYSGRQCLLQKDLLLI